MVSPGGAIQSRSDNAEPAPYPHLRDFVYDEQTRQDLIQQSVLAANEVIGSQRGALGLTVRAAYRMARGLAPRQIETIVDSLLDDFLDVLTPFFHEALDKGEDVEEYIAAQRERVAERVFEITDERASTEKEGPLLSGYRRLRPTTFSRLVDSIPRMARLVKENLPEELRAPARTSAR